MSDRPIHCRDCGNEIIFIRLKNGKFMPCDARAVYYRAGGKTTLYRGNGTEILGCEIYAGASKANVFDYSLQSAFIPHWATCKAKGFGKTVGRTKAIRT